MANVMEFMVDLVASVSDKNIRVRRVLPRTWVSLKSPSFRQLAVVRRCRPAHGDPLRRGFFDLPVCVTGSTAMEEGRLKVGSS
jgi:hypothetical protein